MQESKGIREKLQSKHNFSPQIQTRIFNTWLLNFFSHFLDDYFCCLVYIFNFFSGSGFLKKIQCGIIKRHDFYLPLKIIIWNIHLLVSQSEMLLVKNSTFLLPAFQENKLDIWYQNLKASSEACSYFFINTFSKRSLCEYHHIKFKNIYFFNLNFY